MAPAADSSAEPTAPTSHTAPEAPDAAEPAETAPAAEDEQAASAEAAAGADASEAEAAAPDDAPAADAADSTDSADVVSDATPPTAVAATEPAPAAQPAEAAGDEFMRDLVAAMRQVADEARQTGMTELRARADEEVRKLDADAERRREDLRTRAEADVAGVGEWAKAEAERITAEAEKRVVARRAQLDQQLAADTTRTESDTRAMRDRVAEYERELEAYHAQLGGINDPAAFAAAAKRMPQPPSLTGATAAPTPTATATASTSTAAPEDEAPVEPATGASNGVPGANPGVHPAEEEVLAARLAQLDATLPEAAASVAAAAEPVTTEVVVKGLGSFGAITGFRQALSAVAGIDGVALSLGQTGEFVFRATHGPGFDVRSAITTLEGDAAKVEERAEGGLRVTLDRAR